MKHGMLRITYNKVPEKLKDLLVSDITILGLSRSIEDTMRGQSLDRVGDLVQLTEARLRHLPNCGVKTVRGIQDSLLKFDLELGTAIKYFPENESYDWRHKRAVLDFDTADRDTRLLLASSLHDFYFPARARRMFRLLGLESIADLIVLPKSEFAKWPNCGQGTLNSVRSTLAGYGLALHTNLLNYDPDTGASLRAAQNEPHPWTSQISDIDFDTADDDMRARLATNVMDYNFPNRALEIFWRAGIKSIADLITLTETELWSEPNCGSQTMLDVTSILHESGFSLSTTIRHYNP